MNYVIFFVISLIIGCQGIKFDPDPYIGDPDNLSIVNSEGISVSCDDVKFSEFAAMHLSKWKELKDILRRARLPKSVRKEIEKSLNYPFQVHSIHPSIEQVDSIPRPLYEY